MNGLFPEDISLVRTDYFISPKYSLQRYKPIKEPIIPGNKRDLTGELDKNDTLPNWLEQNSFLFEFRQDNYASEIHGKNNVYCRIIGLRIPEQRINPENNSGPVIIPYHRVVRVRSMPNNLDSHLNLPEELSTALRNRDYEFRTEECDLVKKFLLQLDEQERIMF